MQGRWLPLRLQLRVQHLRGCQLRPAHLAQSGQKGYRLLQVPVGHRPHRHGKVHEESSRRNNFRFELKIKFKDGTTSRKKERLQADREEGEETSQGHKGHQARKEGQRQIEVVEQETDEVQV